MRPCISAAMSRIHSSPAILIDPHNVRALFRNPKAVLRIGKHLSARRNLARKFRDELGLAVKMLGDKEAI